MPKRLIRKALLVVDKHANMIIFLLAFGMLLVAVFAAVGWHNARNAQTRLTTVEEKQQAEELGKNIADVTSCFNRAKSRPGLVVILRGIAVKLDPNPRAATLKLIDSYEQNTPTVDDCVRLARKRNIDPKPYLRNPPSQAGTGKR